MCFSPGTHNLENSQQQEALTDSLYCLVLPNKRGVLLMLTELSCAAQGCGCWAVALNGPTSPSLQYPTIAHSKHTYPRKSKSMVEYLAWIRAHNPQKKCEAWKKKTIAGKINLILNLTHKHILTETKLHLKRTLKPQSFCKGIWSLFTKEIYKQYYRINYSQADKEIHWSLTSSSCWKQQLIAAFQEKQCSIYKLCHLLSRLLYDYMHRAKKCTEM